MAVGYGGQQSPGLSPCVPVSDSPGGFWGWHPMRSFFSRPWHLVCPELGPLPHPINAAWSSGLRGGAPEPCELWVDVLRKASVTDLSTD